MFIGTLLGLGAALCQSLSYLFSGHYVRAFHSSTRELLVLAHAVMTVVCLVLLAILRPSGLPPLSVYGPPLVGGSFFYVCGQSALFMALRSTDASRVSPLLGLKLPILALLSVSFLGEVYTPLQWLAVVVCLTAAFLLSRSGVRISPAGLGWVLLACLGYCLSDLNIKLLVQRFEAVGMPLARAALVGACLSYLLLGSVALVLLPTVPWRDRKRWRFAIPFALAWFAGMLFLFACFGATSVVFGNIVQSTRGLMSVILGAMVARAGYLHLESKVSRSVLLRRIAAAVLMVMAIVMFALGRRKETDSALSKVLFSHPCELSYRHVATNLQRTRFTDWRSRDEAPQHPDHRCRTADCLHAHRSGS